MRLKLLGKVREIPDFVPVILLDILLLGIAIYLLNLYYSHTPYYPTLLAIVIFAALLVPFFYIYRHYKEIQEKEKFFPQFLKDLADIHHTGMSLVQAAYHTAGQNYGPLTPHVKKLAVRLSWGVPFEEAFELFAKETGSPLIQSAVLIILEAFSSGGNIPTILETVAEDARKLKDLQEERRSRFAPFVGTMYVVFLVSLVLSHILLNILIPEMPVIPTFTLTFSPAAGHTLGSTVSIPEYSLKILFLHLLIIEAVVSGLMAGIVGEGSWAAGLKYVLTMSFIALLVFHLYILPIDPVDRLGRALTKLPLTLNMTVDLGEFYVEKNITKDEVVRFIDSYQRTFGLERKIEFWFEEDIGCKPCVEGNVTVTDTAIYIRHPLYLNFRVVSNGDGTATVFVR